MTDNSSSADHQLAALRKSLRRTQWLAIAALTFGACSLAWTIRPTTATTSITLADGEFTTRIGPGAIQFQARESGLKTYLGVSTPSRGSLSIGEMVKIDGFESGESASAQIRFGPILGPSVDIVATSSSAQLMVSQQENGQTARLGGAGLGGLSITDNNLKDGVTLAPDGLRLNMGEERTSVSTGSYISITHRDGRELILGMDELEHVRRLHQKSQRP